MSDDTFSGADFTAAVGGDTSTSSEPVESVATVDTPAPPEAATTAPAAGITAPGSTEPVKAGPIPFDVHKTALENARTKALEEYKQQHGWAETVDRRAIEEAQRLGQLYTQDRAGYIRQVLSEAVSDPSLAPIVRSEVALLLGAGRQAQPNTPDLTPIPVQMENGQTIGLFTSDQIGALKAQWMQEMEQKIAPLQQTHEQLQQANELFKAKAQAASWAQGFGPSLAELPHFHEIKGEIRARLKDMNLETDHPAEVRAATYQVYIQTLAEKVLPNLRTDERRAVLHDINQKAQVSTVNPGAPSATTPKDMKDMSWSEALKAGFANMR